MHTSTAPEHKPALRGNTSTDQCHSGFFITLIPQTERTYFFHLFCAWIDASVGLIYLTCSQTLVTNYPDPYTDGLKEKKNVEIWETWHDVERQSRTPHI